MPALLPPDQCYTGEEVARILRLKPHRFYRLRKRLEQDGMPEGIRCGRELRYSREAFDRWLNNPRRDMPPQPDVEAAIVRRGSERLLRAYGARR
jgi:hypothetical protein